MLRQGRIRCTDLDRHAGFFAFVAAMFPGAGAERWHLWRDRGGWTDRYEVFTLQEGDTLVATIGRSRMRLRADGVVREGFQLGAVATHPAWRGQGLAARLMRAVTDDLDSPDRPLLLFANPSVLAFYPRFGFRRLPRARARAALPLAPAGPPAPRLDPSDPAARARLARLCAAAVPHAGSLAPLDYGWLALWHLSCGPARAHLLPGPEALVASSLGEDGWLVLHEVLAPARFDLAPWLPRLIDRPVAGVEFSFDPGGWWSGATNPAPADPEATLFLRGAPGLAGPVLFPDLAHT